MGGQVDQRLRALNFQLCPLLHSMGCGNRKGRQILPLRSGLYIRNEVKVVWSWKGMEA